MTKIKICGIQTVEDALFCGEAGADAVGLVFAESPRKVSLEVARHISAALPPFVSRIGVFVDADKDAVKRIVGYCGLNVLQFHGNEDAQYCRSFALPVVKAFRIQNAEDLNSLDRFPAAAYLLDTYHSFLAGGTGRTFDWNLVEQPLARPLILAGGLNKDNVTEAIESVRPYAVDVSSGVETDANKDRKKIQEFITTVRRCA